MFFKKSENSAQSSRRHSADGGVTILTSGCQFSGKLCCKGVTRIGGRVDGEIISEGMLILEEGAVINADAKVDEIVLHGSFTGKLHVNIKAELSHTASFDGEVQTPLILVHEGAQFNGQVKMAQAQDKSNFVGIDEIHKKKFPHSKEVNSVSELTMTK